VAADPGNPREVRVERLVRRVVLPVWVETECVGVLDLGWRGARRISLDEPVPQHNFGELAELAGALADAIRTHRLHTRSTLADRVINGATAFLFRKAHRLGGRAGEMEVIIQEVLDSDGRVDPALLADRIPDITKASKEIGSIITRAQKLMGELARETPALARTQVGKILEKLVKAVRPAAEEAGIEVTLDQLIEFEGRVFPNLLREAFENVIQNALRALKADAARRGGKHLRITLRGSREGGVVVEFRDNGPGIPPAVLAKVKQRKPVGASRSGSGHGLFLTRIICEHHHGTLAFHDPPTGQGPGAVVVITIPRAEVQ
jgi:signal transduction histidine kinase